MSATTEALPVTVSPRAAARIAKILAKEPAGAMLRVAVNGGGCSGFQYDFSIDTSRNDDDLAIEKDGVTVLVDETSLEFMRGAEIDFADELIGAAFKINNPNATASCGCGIVFGLVAQTLSVIPDVYAPKSGKDFGEGMLDLGLQSCMRMRSWFLSRLSPG
ncbi:MAG: iron-sulfur cluster insertion protein ErpA [Parvularculaceae bacterium]